MSDRIQVDAPDPFTAHLAGAEPAPLYRCAGARCPGLPYRPSDAAHPLSCVGAGLTTDDGRAPILPAAPDEAADTDRAAAARASRLDLFRVYLCSRAAGLLGEESTWNLAVLDDAELIAVNIGAESAKVGSWLERADVERIVHGRLGVEVPS